MPNKFVSNGMLLDLLKKASGQERMILTKILNISATMPLTADELQLAICSAGGHSAMNWMRGQGTGYIDMLDDVVKVLKIKGLPAYHGEKMSNGLKLNDVDELATIILKKSSLEECRLLGIAYVEMAENKILISLLDSAYQKMNPEQRRAFDAKVKEVAAQFGAKSVKDLAGGAGLIVVGNLGGFATYTLMSTVLSTISLGTLGFGVYTAASSLLSLVLGPVGWVALGGAAIHKFGKSDMSKVIPLIVNIALMRQRINPKNRLAHTR